MLMLMLMLLLMSLGCHKIDDDDSPPRVVRRSDGPNGRVPWKLLSDFGFLVDQRMSVVKVRRLAVGPLQNIRPQCKFNDRLVTIGELFLSFHNEFSSFMVDSEKMFNTSGIVAEL